MYKIGLIVEYNPLHNGHIYHINKVKELYPDSLIIVVMSGNFLQRGDTSLINKWDKTKLALMNGVDLVIELPFVFATQSADKFAHGAIQILDNLKVNKIVFGSECNDINILKSMASVQINNMKYDNLVKKYMKEGINYPTAMSYALEKICGNTVKLPNDILGVCYIKEILSLKSNMEPITIKRTNDYNSTQLNLNICSATAIRQALREKKDISKYVPEYTLSYIKKECFIENYFPFLKYKIMTCKDLSIYETVDTGISYRVKKNIVDSNSLDELINKVKTKYYTYNRLKRMFIHILCDFTKRENLLCTHIHYIRVLGFNKCGKEYLNCIKKECNLPIISNFTSLRDIMLDIENRSTLVYSLIYGSITELEKPIIRQ